MRGWPIRMEEIAIIRVDFLPKMVHNAPACTDSSSSSSCSSAMVLGLLPLLCCYSSSSHPPRHGRVWVLYVAGGIDLPRDVGDLFAQSPRKPLPRAGRRLSIYLENR
ncbi:unnamed protein product [Ectocarpus sp. 12 AP-2014]